MRRIMRCWTLPGLICLALALPAAAQYLTFGSVTQAIPIEPGAQGMTFWLADGAYSPTGKIHQNDYDNHFSFVANHFVLDRTDHAFCKIACHFEGDFITFGSVPISLNCTQLLGSLVGTLNGQPVTADYSQMWCHLATTQYLGGGEFSVVY